jgi:hypothetical protein
VRTTSLGKIAPDVIGHIDRAWDAWRTWGETFRALRRSAHGAEVEPSQQGCEALVAAALEIDAAIVRLKQRTGALAPANAAAGQLELASAILMSIATGANDGYNYDLADFERRVMYGLKYALLWADGH